MGARGNSQPDSELALEAGMDAALGCVGVMFHWAAKSSSMLNSAPATSESAQSSAALGGTAGPTVRLRTIGRRDDWDLGDLGLAER